MANLPRPLAAAIGTAARRYRVPARTLEGIWRIESGSTFPNPAVNPEGYGGLFGTHRWNASTQAQANYAASILSSLLRQHGGNMAAALHDYSGGGYSSVPGGPGRVVRSPASNAFGVAPSLRPPLPPIAVRFPRVAQYAAPRLTAPTSSGGLMHAPGQAAATKAYRGFVRAAPKLEANIARLSAAQAPMSRVQTPATTVLPSPPGAIGGIIHTASQFLGTPYKWGGTSPRTGFDCSGFVQYVYGLHGIRLPRTTYEQVHSGRAVSRRNLQAGDILFFEPSPEGPAHEGLYIGGGKFIEAPHTGSNVRISNLAARTDYVTARRVV